MKPNETNDDETVPPALREVKYEYTPALVDILTHLNTTILVSTYQAGKLLVLGAKDGKLTISFLDYEQPMGLAVSPHRIAVGSRRQMHFLVPAHETQERDSKYDSCYVPRTSFYTGNVHGHDLAWGREGLWVVNTLFSCLSTLHEDYSFVPRWKPPFISQLIDQDRCHLNGMAMVEGEPKFVTAMSQTDTAAGWRPNKANGGVVMEVPSGDVMCSNLSMPHSPRFYSDRLWVLDSGRGAFGYVDQSSGKYQTVEQLPGYTRGLSFAGQFAFVGLSKIRETSVFGGVPIAEKRDELRCGVGVIDLTTGKTVAVFQFHSGVTEIFAVEALRGFSNPLIAGASVDQQEREVWIVPNPNGPIPVVKPSVPLFATPSIDGGSSSGDLSPAQLIDLGNKRQEQGNQPSAMLCYQRALEIDPKCIPALQNLGYLAFNMGEAEKASDVYDRLLAIEPSAINYLLAASVLPVIYDSEAEVQHWRERQLKVLEDLAATGEQVDATKSLVPTCFFAAYKGLNDRDVMQRRAAAVKGTDFTSRQRAERSDNRLRVGFVSAYFRNHTIGRLNIGRLENLSREKIHLSVIYAGREQDEMSERFRATADDYIRLPRDLPSAIATMSELDLDVLVHADVGMDSLTQTLAFSRFAPVQAATWGHPDTTGSTMMDYFISSVGLESENSSEAYSEDLVLLPSLGIQYERPSLPEKHKIRNDLGLSDDANLYGCPQTLFKFHPDFDEILAGILEADPIAELVLLEGRLPEWTHRLRRRFRRTLPEAGKRVRFLPALPHEDFLSLVANVNVLLDPIHFGGGNSSLEALAIETPLVTMRGDYLRSRITSTIYESVDFTDLIASDAEQYIGLATRVVNDDDFRVNVLRKIRDASKALFDQAGQADELEHCLLTMTKAG
ncbi:TIGR03032 family protein [Rubripirellula amarantea]|nr:TIGR03032 family protein [Rubripirellula amarantea]